MLMHVVLFDFKKEVTEDNRKEILELAKNVLPTLPGVTNLVVGKNIKQNAGQQYALSMNFTDAKALETYRIHPDHEHFRDKDFFPYLENVKGIDYED